MGQAITKCGLVLASLASGVQQVDLIENPWEADFAALSTRRKKVMSSLTKTGMFGDYSNSLFPKKGKNWTRLSNLER